MLSLHVIYVFVACSALQSVVPTLFSENARGPASCCVSPLQLNDWWWATMCVCGDASCPPHHGLIVGQPLDVLGLTGSELPFILIDRRPEKDHKAMGNVVPCTRTAAFPLHTATDTRRVSIQSHGGCCCTCLSAHIPFRPHHN